MFHVVYTSTATHPMPSSDLAALLATSRRNNAARGLTGLLLDKHGTFMQVLEGERADWSMGCRDLGGPAARDLDGYSEFMNTPLNAPAFAADPTRAQRLLLMFKRVTER